MKENLNSADFNNYYYNELLSPEKTGKIKCKNIDLQDEKLYYFYYSLNPKTLPRDHIKHTHCSLNQAKIQNTQQISVKLSQIQNVLVCTMYLCRLLDYKY